MRRPRFPARCGEPRRQQKRRTNPGPLFSLHPSKLATSTPITGREIKLFVADRGKTDCQRHATETDENCMSMVGNTLSPVSSPRCAWLKTLHCWQRETCAWYCGRIVAIQGFPPRPRESCFYRFRVVDGVGPAARTNSSAFKVAQAHGRALSVPWQAQARKDEVGVAVFADGGIRLRD